MYLLGYDIGSSSIKVALVESESKSVVALAQYPDTEMEIISHHPGWAEQSPDIWWDNLCQATRKLLQSTNVDPHDIGGIGIAYQMHGLVLVDKNQQLLRPSIIWCDSRAVEIGNQAFNDLGADQCLSHLLNSPGNFTASKFKWVKDHEPELFERAHEVLLPGDYIAMRLTGEISTTVSGLSEGMFWDFKNNQVAEFLLEYYGIDSLTIPEIVPTFSNQGSLQDHVAGLLGLKPGIPVGYRAGDQPNNAMSLNVLKPGEVAATGGTSGVVFGVVDRPVYDPEMRVNGFAHVNHQIDHPSVGILLCINGAGIQYSWMKKHLAAEKTTYQDMERMASEVPINSEGLRVIPFGNGAERMLGNRNVGSHLINLQLNRHGASHIYRATLEGIAFGFAYGIEVLKEMGLSVAVMKVGNDNLFQSPIFSTSVASLVNCEIQVMETTGAVGAAKAAGIAAGAYSSIEEALGETRVIETFEPDAQQDLHEQGYAHWKADLERLMGV
jgi:xylulokinase